MTSFAKVSAGIIAALMIAMIGLIGDFHRRLASSPAPSSLPRTAIVFTGQFDRVEMGLQLMEKRVIDRLLISGVNPGAGLAPAHFADQFGLSPDLRAALQSGRIALAPLANTTLENAIEAACWLRQNPQTKNAILITSSYHMPRASLSLERTLPSGFGLVRMVSQGAGSERNPPILSREFRKFIATWIMALLPKKMWPGVSSSRCP